MFAKESEKVVDRNYWTTECAKDELFLNLARVEETITKKGEDNIKILRVKKYYRQARGLMRWIPIARPPPDFVINTSDLTPEVKQEIESLIPYPKTLQEVTHDAVGRIFENLDFRYYHLSIARNLRVRFES